ncbi:MAG: hypothetical protein IH969_05245 [Candidatus Krumholzibacteriota bacterium]|nr:hypothetical protein [Candidatus Krumholzibacteriota bacterium]
MSVLVALILLAVVLFVVAYRTYGKFLDRTFGIDAKNITPAHTEYDGVDYVPASTPVLMGHHFSSIAGAGPIVGPIIAVAFFGWLPAVIWIVVGSILVGARLVHVAVEVHGRVEHLARHERRQGANVVHIVHEVGPVPAGQPIVADD